MDWERFWNRVDRRAPSECWLWRGRDLDGWYGRATVNGVKQGTHRHVVEFILGRPMREGMYAVHSCDRKPCCNPAHVREATSSENALERWDRVTPRKCERGESVGLNGAGACRRRAAVGRFVFSRLIRRIAMRGERFRVSSVWRAGAGERRSRAHEGHETRMAALSSRLDALDGGQITAWSDRRADRYAACTLWNDVMPAALPLAALTERTTADAA